MASRHINSFLRKSWPERYRTAQFYLRRGLAKLPYLPVPLRLKISSTEEIRLWWSQFVPFFDRAPRILGLLGRTMRMIYDSYGKFWSRAWCLWISGLIKGIYSLVAGKKLRRDGLVIAFEPSPREYRRLCMNLRLNRMSGARAEMMALWCDRQANDIFPGKLRRHRAKRAAGPRNFRSRYQDISRSDTSLDEYVARHPMNAPGYN